MKKAFEVVAVLLVIFLTLPIWFYLLYKVLEAVHATELMWFLFWIYIPATAFVSLVAQLTKSKD